MNITVRDLITQAYRISGIRSPIETPNANDLQMGLFELNGLIDMLRLDENWAYSTYNTNVWTSGGTTEYSVAFRSQVNGWDWFEDSVNWGTLTVGGTLVINSAPLQGNLTMYPEPYYPFKVGDSVSISQENGVITGIVATQTLTSNGQQLHITVNSFSSANFTGTDTQGIIYTTATTTYTPVGKIKPDWIVKYEITEVNTCQVLVGSVFVNMKQISADDYYRTNRNIALNIIPNQFAYNRSRDPWDMFMLQTPSAGGYRCQISYHGFTTNMLLDDSLVDLPSGYAPALEYGLAEKLSIAYGFDNPAIAVEWRSRLKRVKKMADRPILLNSRRGYGLWSVGSDTVIYSGGSM